ncbi:uncharacterized protein LOC100206117 isoform X1 [Hydra vulgaris]|uniref:uncharacterized protein LOC100206117 isoform X1 n=1 Tax=Hydra vulgaris TaxID=6087 RepID=UPI000640CCFC|nr:uncharacterized protein LOC100206117 [Hydra vulgaris]
MGDLIDEEKWFSFDETYLRKKKYASSLNGDVASPNHSTAMPSPKSTSNEEHHVEISDLISNKRLPVIRLLEINKRKAEVIDSMPGPIERERSKTLPKNYSRHGNSNYNLVTSSGSLSRKGPPNKAPDWYKQMYKEINTSIEGESHLYKLLKFDAKSASSVGAHSPRSISPEDMCNSPTVEDAPRRLGSGRINNQRRKSLPNIHAANFIASEAEKKGMTIENSFKETTKQNVIYPNDFNKEEIEQLKNKEKILEQEMLQEKHEKERLQEEEEKLHNQKNLDRLLAQAEEKNQKELELEVQRIKEERNKLEYERLMEEEKKQLAEEERLKLPSQFVQAKYSFNPEGPGELMFKKTDIIHLLRRIDENWLEGELNGCVGIFPVSYVEFLLPGTLNVNEIKDSSQDFLPVKNKEIKNSSQDSLLMKNKNSILPINDTINASSDEEVKTKKQPTTKQLVKEDTFIPLSTSNEEESAIDCVEDFTETEHELPLIKQKNNIVDMTINTKHNRYPYCIVWTPIPVLTWFFPFIGHMGIAYSSGVIRDFSASYYVSEDEFGFGNPTKYLQFNPSKVTKDNWDDAVMSASEEYTHRRHNLYHDNCHSHVAMSLNLMGYNGKTSWNNVNLALQMFAYGKHTSTFGFIKSWLPFLIILLIIMAIIITTSALL